MQYRQDAVTPPALAFVLAHLWERGVEELRRIGLSRDEAFARFMDYAQRGRSGVMYADDVPVLACGTCPEEGGRFTWFQATDAFVDHAIQITRWLRKELKRDEGPVYIYSVCVHPETERWFHALGCERDGWVGRTAAGFPLYRFARR